MCCTKRIFAVLTHWWRSQSLRLGQMAPLNPYTRIIVEGGHGASLPNRRPLATYSADWPIARMPAVDRNLLRIGTWELLWAQDVPTAVAISEAVELSKDLSTDESPSFINGVLGQIGDIKDHLVLEP